MRVTFKSIRLVLVIAALALVLEESRQTLYAFPDDCADICPTAGCNTQCYANAVEFENGNMISCRDYGVYDTSQMCCGDAICSAETGETVETCAGDCYVPPVEPQTTILVNGSLTPSMPDWMQTGSPTFNAIADTYNGQAPIQFFWAQNSIGEVTWPDYSGIYAGAALLAAEVNSRPAGEIVNFVAHSHGGNVLIASMAYLNRPVKHLIELGTPVNWDLPRYSVGFGAQYRCTASSWVDDVQFSGASPYQVAGYFIFLSESIDLYNQAWAYLANGDEENWAIYMAFAYAASEASEWFWRSTKLELDGDTITWTWLNHSQMHEPFVWNQLPYYCKVGG